MSIDPRGVKKSADQFKSKRFLQACDTGGSLYGRIGNRQGITSNHTADNKTDITESYRKLYREQMRAMSRVFGKGTT